MQPESEVCASESDLRILILSWDVVDSLIKQLNIMIFKQTGLGGQTSLSRDNSMHGSDHLLCKLLAGVNHGL